MKTPGATNFRMLPRSHSGNRRSRRACRNRYALQGENRNKSTDPTGLEGKGPLEMAAYYFYPKNFSAWPTASGELSSAWGNRKEPTAGTGDFHSGIDIAVPNGTEVRALDDGRVSQVADHPQYGKTVVIDYESGLVSAEMHNSSISVKVGDTVVTGEEVAQSGSTGAWTTGGHSHTSVWDSASKVPDFTKDSSLIVTRDTVDPSRLLPPIPNSYSVGSGVKLNKAGNYVNN